jgi:hypothetical protein
MKKYTLLLFVLTPAVLGLVAVIGMGVLYLRARNDLDALRSANKKQLREVALDEATVALTKAGCSNFMVMLIGDCGASQRAALVQSNHIWINVDVNVRKEEESGKPSVTLRHQL